MPSFRPQSVRARWAFASLLATLAPASVRGQTPTPTPIPPRLPFQDQLDLQANANVVQGSGARAFGMGGAFLARADDATAASWNPAGLSYLRFPEISFVFVGGDLGAEKTLSPSGDPSENDRRHGSAPDFLAFTYPFSIGSTSGAAQISYQRVISFDNNRTIDEPGLSEQIRSSGGFDVIALGSGWQLTRSLRLGATLNRWLNGYSQTVDVPAPRSVPTRQNTRFGISGWNAHVGVMWSPFESLNLGAVLKTGFSADVDLKRSRVDFFETEEGTVQTSNAHEADDLVMSFPGAMGVGASWRPRSNITLSLDYTRTRWSSGMITNFFTIQRTEPGQPPPVPVAPHDFFPVKQYPTLLDANQQDTSQLRFGAEYVVIGERLKWPIRAGYFTDDQYFQAVGGAPRFHGVTVGAGLIVGPILLDVAYLRETGSYLSFDTTTTDSVLLKNDVKSNRIFASIIYRHSKHP